MLSTLKMQGRVCIVGGGLSGLVSGKACIDAGLRPVIFEAGQAPGGMWNPDLSRCWGSLRTNLSRHLCQLHDHPWHDGAPLFPTQADVGAYLRSYKSRFIPDETLRLGCRVTQIVPAADGTFEVHWRSARDPPNVEVERFDNVIVAAGFFLSPQTPKIEGLETFPGPCIHSGEYRTPEAFEGKRVAVVGSSFSATELAAEIARHASTVLNIVPRPSWVVPRFLPLEPASPSTPFVPLDLLLYRRGAPAAPAPTAEEAHRGKVAALRAFFGSSARDPLHALRGPEDAAGPPYVAISETYSNLLRAGKIEAVQGELASVAGGSLRVSPRAPGGAPGDAPGPAGGADTVLEGVEAMVLCTGYRPSIDFLGEGVLRGVEYDGEDGFCPLVAYRGVMHPELRGMAFVGMYRGAYFGVVDLQARLAAGLLSGQVEEPTESQIQEDLAATRALRDQVPRPQLPFDYVTQMDELSRDLGTAPAGELLAEGLPISPAHFFGDVSAAQRASAAVDNEIRDLRGGKHITRAIFRSLPGRWTFKRTLTSWLDGAPSGEVEGEIVFDGAGLAGGEDLWYREDGVFKTSTGLTFMAKQWYFYTYNEENDSLDVYFAKKENPELKGHLLVSMRFVPESEGWTSMAYHLCSADHYNATYTFAFDGVELKKITITFKVDGPMKDYKSVTVLTRPSEDSVGQTD